MAPFSVKLLQPYKSLVQFDWKNLPDLCVITGTSGTGKSHLLEMIARHCQAIGDNAQRSDPVVVEASISGVETGSGKVLFVPADRATDFSENVTLAEVEKRITHLYDVPLSN
ncbi:hypothetical protein EOS_31945, partial [Caballeronia mineralivorans PML1(12)]